MFSHSAGVGRTGTFISIYSLADMMRETGKVDIYGFISQMREDRILMVQTRVSFLRKGVDPGFQMWGGGGRRLLCTQRSSRARSIIALVQRPLDALSCYYFFKPCRVGGGGEGCLL